MCVCLYVPVSTPEQNHLMASSRCQGSSAWSAVETSWDCTVMMQLSCLLWSHHFPSLKETYTHLHARTHARTHTHTHTHTKLLWVLSCFWSNKQHTWRFNTIGTDFWAHLKWSPLYDRLINHAFDVSDTVRRFGFSKYNLFGKYQCLSMWVCMCEKQRVRSALFSPQEVNISLSCLASDVVTRVTLVPCVAGRWRWIINGQPHCTLLHWTESTHIHSFVKWIWTGIRSQRIMGVTSVPSSTLLPHYC